MLCRDSPGSTDRGTRLDTAVIGNHPRQGWLLQPLRLRPTLTCFRNKGGGDGARPAYPQASQPAAGGPVWGPPQYGQPPWGYPQGYYQPGYGPHGYPPAGFAGASPAASTATLQQPQPVPQGGTGVPAEAVAEAPAPVAELQSELSTEGQHPASSDTPPLT